MICINIFKDFAESTGGRDREKGLFSGQEFREDLLYPKAIEAINNKDKLFIDLDGGYGHSSSFLEEAFGGLIRQLSREQAEYIINNIEIKSLDEPRKKEDIKLFMMDESSKKH